MKLRSRLSWRAALAAAVFVTASAAVSPALALPSDDEKAGIGVAPSVIERSSALRGSTFEENLILLNGLSGDREFTLTPTGAVAGWLSFRDQAGAVVDRVVLPQEGNAVVSVRVAVPAETANGDYEGRIEVLSRPVGGADGSGQDLGIGAIVILRVNVGGTMNLAGRLTQVIADDAEVGRDAIIYAQFVNQGNVSFVPTIAATIRKGSQVAAELSVTSADPIFPGQSSDVPVPWDTTDALPGTYDVSVTATAPGLALGEAATTLRLGPPNKLGRAGELSKLVLVNEPEPGGAARLRATFVSGSELPVPAIVVGDVERDGSFLGQVKSLETVVSAGATTDLDLVIPDLVDGEYRVVALVSFDGRSTEKREVTFTVGTGGPPLMMMGAGLVGIALIGAAFYLVRRRRAGAASAETADAVEVGA